MRMKDIVHNHYKRILADPEYKNVKECNFLANDGDNRKWVYLADVMGLDWPEYSHCHVNLSLYYETHKALTIPFATHKDAWYYVESKGKIDHRITKKDTAYDGGWKLTLKEEVE